MVDLQEKANANLPLVEEVVGVTKKKRVTGKVRVRTDLVDDLHTVDEPLRVSAVEIERRPVERWVDAPVPPRQEDDTTIISVMEEVLVVRTRWKVVEEIRLTRRESVRHDPRQVVLRHTRATVERRADKDVGEP